MSDYVVTHIWHQADGTPYLRIVPGTVPHIDIACYAAGLLADYTGEAVGVYLLDPDTAEMIRQDCPPAPSMDPADIPKLRVTPGSNDGDPPDLVTAPNAGGGTGIGLLAGPGLGVATTPPETGEETDPTPE